MGCTGFHPFPHFFDDDLSTRDDLPLRTGETTSDRGSSDVQHAVPLQGKQPLTAAPPHFARLDW